MGGEMNYAGFLITRISPGTSIEVIAERVRHYMNKYVRKRDNVDDKKYEYYEKKSSPIRALKINNVTEGPSKLEDAVVYGVDFPYDVIRYALKGRQIGEDDIIFTGPDFGTMRNERTGHFYSVNDDQLHGHLKEGCGFINEPLKVLKDSFWHQDVGMEPKNMKNVITINLRKKDIKSYIESSSTDQEDKEKISNMSGYLQFTKHSSKPEEDTGTDIEFFSKLEAMQAMHYWNGAITDPNTNEIIRFKSDRTTNTIPGKGFGKNGEKLNIRELMETKGYIPFDMLRDGIVNEKKTKSEWVSRCRFCGNVYELLGFHPDFTWIAAKCHECDPLVENYAWPGEPFFRLTMAYKGARIHSNFTHHENLVEQPLVLMTKGLLPLYGSVEEFEKSGLAAEEHEFAVEKAELASHSSKAKVIDISDPLEDEDDASANYNKHYKSVLLKLPTHGIWTPEGRCNIKKIKLIPLGFASKFGSKGPSNGQLRLIEGEGVFMGGTLEYIRCSGNDSIVEVKMWLTDDDELELKVDETFVIVPLPPDGFMDAIKLGVSTWKSYLNARNCVSPCEMAPLYSSVPLFNQNPADGDATTTVGCRIRFPVKINVFTNQMLKNVGDSRLYFGVMISDDRGDVLGRFDPVNTHHGVIINVEEHAKQSDTVTITALVKTKTNLIEGAKHVLAVWIGRDSDANVEEEDDFLESMSIPIEGVAKDKAMVMKSGRDQDYLATINRCPVSSVLDMRDFLLKSNVERVNHFSMSPTSAHMKKIKAIVSSLALNKSQKRALTASLSRVFTNIIGPPGCGKTTILCRMVMAMRKLYSKENESGMAVIVCPTNLSAKIVAETLHEMNLKEHAGHKIRRMLAFGKEATVVINEENEEHFVHSAIKQHPLYKSDETAMKIIDKKKKNTNHNMLSEKEENYLWRHTSDIRKLVLDDTDVLILTADTCMSRRMQDYFSNKSYTKRPKGVFVDECNLMSTTQFIPLLALNPTHFVQIGDDKQLTRTYSSRTAVGACADVSLMQFFAATPYFKEENHEHILLNEQYRFQDKLCRFISEFLYDGKLISSPEILKRDKKLPYKDTSFYEVFPELKNNCLLRMHYKRSKYRSETKRGHSFSNEYEARAIAMLVEQITGAGVGADKITILTGYQLQIDKLEDYVPLPLPEPNVVNEQICTIDSFEGRQRPIIILSMVRCNEKAEVGFMEFAARLNVAISRPQYYLFIVCNEDTFTQSKSPVMESFFKLLNDMKFPKREIDLL